MNTVDTNAPPAKDILVVDDSPDDLELLTNMLEKIGCKARSASGGEMALRSVHTKMPDLIMLDVRMPGMDGYEVCSRLKASEVTRDIPVIFLSRLGDSMNKVKAFGIGGVDYIIKPFDLNEVRARVQTHLTIQSMQQRLKEQNIQLHAAKEQLERRVQHRAKALEESENRYHNLFQTAAVSMWEEDFTKVKEAIDVIKAENVGDFRKYLSENPGFVSQAAGMVTILDVNQYTLKMYGAKNKEDLLVSLDRIFVPESFDIFAEELIAIAEGESHFKAESVTQNLQGERVNTLVTITFPAENGAWNNVPVSMVDITDRKRMEEQLKYQAVHDPLTGVYNRNMLEQQMTDEVYRAARYNHSLSVFMLDIDHFKNINDTYGHGVGDIVLRDLATLIKNSIRKPDYVARYGGEEFVVILPETSLHKARELAERLRRQVASYTISIKEDQTLSLTISIGVATYPDHTESPQNLLEAADKAMYVAKRQGRDRVQTAHTQTK